MNDHTGTVVFTMALGTGFMALCIFGVVKIGQQLKHSHGLATFALVLAMIALSLFGLAGFASAGCVASLQGSHF